MDDCVNVGLRAVDVIVLRCAMSLIQISVIKWIFCLQYCLPIKNWFTSFCISVLRVELHFYSVMHTIRLGWLKAKVISISVKMQSNQRLKISKPLSIH